MKPKVSVIIPTFGRTDFLSDAIDSVFSQTFRDFELIIVDDNDPGSEWRKETEMTIGRYQANGRELIYVQHEKNKNGAAARNTGFKVSSGEYISFLDSDDIYCNKRLAVAVAVMEGADEDVGGVYTGVKFRRNKRTYNVYRDTRPGNFLKETLACRFMIGTGSNLFIRRQVLEELGGFDESFQRHQDYEFLVRFFQRYRMAASSDVLVIKNNGNFNQPPISRHREINRQFLKKYRSLIEVMPKADQDYIFRSNFVALGELALREGLRRESNELYAQASRRGRVGRRTHLRRIVFWTMSWFK